MENRYILNYLDEKNYKKLERSLKKYNIATYKKLVFEVYPELRSGKFLGELVFINNHEHTETYVHILPTDSLFAKVYGKIKLNYTVYKDYQMVMLNSMEPKDILLDGYKSELIAYKDIMISKANAEKEMFKIDLLRRLEGLDDSDAHLPKTKKHTVKHENDSIKNNSNGKKAVKNTDVNKKNNIIKSDSINTPNTEIIVDKVSADKNNNVSVIITIIIIIFIIMMIVALSLQ